MFRPLAVLIVAMLPLAPADFHGPCCQPAKQRCEAVGHKADSKDSIRDASVTIKASSSRGSGTLFMDKDGDVWALTASHVVHGEKSVHVQRHQIVADGQEEMTWVYAAVHRDVPEEDICLLHVGRRAVFPGATKFHVGKAPPAGTQIIHCGTFNGTLHHSVVRGEITTVGRPWAPFAFKDQLDITGWYGSSGGGVHLTDGKYIGMVTHGIPGSHVIMMTPVRRILAWADKEKLGHIFCRG